MSVSFDFHPGISGLMVSFSEIQQFPDFLELFPEKFRIIFPRFENFEILGRMVSAPSVPLQRVENEDIWYMTERDWSQESFHGNKTMGVIWFLL